MKKVTYLFGAGASRHALPIVGEIPGRILSLIKKLEDKDLELDSSETFSDLNFKNPKSKRDYQLEMIESLKWMLDESQKHASVDTFAKKLYIKHRSDLLKKLKISLSIFFILEQVLNKPDFRYDAFFASILNSYSSFPSNIKIINWNYDYQFEISYSEYSDQIEIRTNQALLRVKAKYGDNLNDNDDGFSIYKLNGTTGLYSDGGWRQYNYINSIKRDLDKSIVEEITRNFLAGFYFNNIQSSLSFAWEGEHPNSSIVKLVADKAKDTDALVVIGYSFPFFNRDIDRKIIGNMTNLKRVYFQAPDADNLKERFQAFKDDIKGIELVSKFDVDQFLLPNEL